jgi:hypothetical protein
VVPNLWFANPLGVYNIFQGVHREMSAMTYFSCTEFDKAIGNLHLLPQHVSEKML